MNPFDFLEELLSNFRNRKKYKGRKMKRVFQWRRYLEWKDLSFEEKLGAKRLLFVPIGAYLIFSFINQYAFTFIFLILLYLAYKKFENGKLMK